jgi:beta-lactamase class A
MIMRKRMFAPLLSAAVLGTLAGALFGIERPAGLMRARSAVARIVKTSSGTVGVAVKHLESGVGFAVNGDVPFPMASVVKLPILTEVMAEIGAGRFGLADEWGLGPADQFYEGSLLSDLKAPGIRLSVENLINMMMWLSDNTATDVLLRKVGIDSVNARMRSFGIDGILVGRTIREILLDYFIGDSRKYAATPKDEIARLYERMAAENPAALAKAQADFDLNPADRATPLALNALLEKIFRKDVLDPGACDHILKVMEGCQTGPRRIRGLLPRDAVVAHKTGTIGGTVNDCGIIELPGGAGHLALSVLSKGADPDRTEDVIALIAKTVYDYFLFAGPGE